MREPYTRLFAHLVWATWDRLPLIGPEVRPRLYRCIAAEAFRMKCSVTAIGGIEDHVHVLVDLAPTASISDLVKQMKGASSRLVNAEIRPGEFFKWQGSYGAFTVAEPDIRRVRNYIRRQEEHHRAGRLSPLLERTSTTDEPHPRPHAPPARAS